MSILFITLFMSLLLAGMQLTWLVDIMDDKEKERQKRIDQISKQIHPHDDEPDPTAHMGNYNFPQMLLLFALVLLLCF